MPETNSDDLIAKIRNLGKILKSEVSRERAMTKQEEKAIQTAIRIQSMHREKFIKEQKKQKVKEKKHEL